MNTTERNWSFVLIAIFAVAVILGIWYFMSNPNWDSNGNLTSVKKPASSATSTKPATQYLTIKEWGKKFQLPSSLSDLEYVFVQPESSSNFDISRADFTTKSLLATDSKCKVGDGLGSAVKQNGTYKTGDGPIEPLIKQFDGYFIDYVAPQSACSDNKQLNDLQTTQIHALEDALKTIQ